MYLRFKTSFTDDDRESRFGVFQAASFLMRNDIMEQYDRQRLKEVWLWFSDNLRAPHVYKQRKSSNNVICWFKPTARRHLQKMYEMIEILEQYGCWVSRVTCDKPGYVVYEDDEQVAAIPFTKEVRQVR